MTNGVNAYSRRHLCQRGVRARAPRVCRTHATAQRARVIRRLAPRNILRCALHSVRRRDEELFPFDVITPQLLRGDTLWQELHRHPVAFLVVVQVVDDLAVLDGGTVHGHELQLPWQTTFVKTIAKTLVRTQ